MAFAFSSLTSKLCPTGCKSSSKERAATALRSHPIRVDQLNLTLDYQLPSKSPNRLLCSSFKMRRHSSSSQPLLGDDKEPRNPPRRTPWVLGIAVAFATILLLIPVSSWSGYDIHSDIEITGDQKGSWKVLQDVERWPRWDVGLDHATIEKVVLHG